MEPRPLTTWEQKERDGLLAFETDEWRQKRLVAEDPNTTADVLGRIAGEIEVGMQGHFPTLPSMWGCDLTANALVAHPNTPLSHLVPLLNRFHLRVRHGFCRNPAAPFFVLEQPDFFEQLPQYSGIHLCEVLLIQENISPSVVNILTHHSNHEVAETARFHIALAGEIQTRAEGIEAINSYWQAFCRTPPVQPFLYGYFRRYTVQEWHEELVTFGLAPEWAARKPLTLFFKRRLIARVLLQNFLPRNFVRSVTRMRSLTFSEYVRQSYLVAIREQHFYSTEFAKFVANLHDVFSLTDLRFMGSSRTEGWYIREAGWQERLMAALKLPVTDDPFGPILWHSYSQLNPSKHSPRDLLQHLAHDGNRFVRWAAQTRLADPNFVFTWHDGDD